MSSGTCVCLFHVGLRGLLFQEPFGFTSLNGQAEATFTPGDKGLMARVRVECESKEIVVERAERLVRETYGRLLLLFGKEVIGSTPPVLSNADFRSGSEKHLAGLSGCTAVVAEASAALSLVVPPAKVKELIHEVQLRLAAPQPASLAALHTAIEMFSLALETGDKVVRFLSLYNAAVLAAGFRGSPGKNEQDQVDILLQWGQSGLQQFPTGRPNPKGMRKLETAYTKLRNDFMHAAERGMSLGSAIAAIRGHVHEFQGLMASILLRL